MITEIIHFLVSNLRLDAIEGLLAIYRESSRNDALRCAAIDNLLATLKRMYRELRYVLLSVLEPTLKDVISNPNLASLSTELIRNLNCKFADLGFFFLDILTTESVE